MSNDDLDRLFLANRDSDELASAKRVDLIVKRIRREVAARDLLTFSLVSVWSTLFRLLEVLLPVDRHRSNRDTDEQSSERPSLTSE